MEVNKKLTCWILSLGGILLSLLGTRGAVYPPRFREQLTITHVGVVKEIHTIRCKVKGFPTPLLTWYYNGEPLTQSDRVRITKYTLHISDLQLSDSGIYFCKATNAAGEIWGNFTLVVVKPKCLMSGPEFSGRTYLVNYIARAATTSVTLDCKAWGYPFPSITWLKDGTPIMAVQDRYDLRGFKLKISHLKLKDEGNYTCIVKNEYGAINRTTRLEVRQRVAIPPLMENVDNQTAEIGDNVTFTCKIIRSDSPPLLLWSRHFKKNDFFVTEKGEPYVKILQVVGAKKLKNTSDFMSTVNEPLILVLHNVTKEDQGWYTCLVANTDGMNYRSAYLTVLNDKSQNPKETGEN